MDVKQVSSIQSSPINEKKNDSKTSLIKTQGKHNNVQSKLNNVNSKSKLIIKNESTNNIRLQTKKQVIPNESKKQLIQDADSSKLLKSQISRNTSEININNSTVEKELTKLIYDNLKKSIDSDINSFNNLTLEKKIKKIRQYFKEILKIEGEHKQIFEHLFKFIDSLLENLEKDKLMSKFNAEVNMHSKTKKTLKEQMTNNEKLNEKIKSSDSDYEVLKNNYKLIEKKLRDNEIIIKRYGKRVEENKNLRNYIFYLESRMKMKNRIINQKNKTLKINNIEHESNNSTKTNFSHMAIKFPNDFSQESNINDYPNHIDRILNEVPGLDLSRIEVGQIDDDEYINSDQQLDEAIEKEISMNPDIVKEQDSLEQFKDQIYNKQIGEDTETSNMSKDEEVQGDLDELNQIQDHQGDKKMSFESVQRNTSNNSSNKGEKEEENSEIKNNNELKNDEINVLQKDLNASFELTQNN